MLLLNAHILNSKHGHKMLRSPGVYGIHEKLLDYRMVCALFTEKTTSLMSQCRKGHTRHSSNAHGFSQLIPRTGGSKRKPSRPCFACNGSLSDVQVKRIPEMYRYLVWNMQKPLCITPCFKIFHTDENSKAILLAKRFQHCFQNANELGSHRSSLSDAALKNFSQCNPMQQIMKLWPLLHVIM